MTIDHAESRRFAIARIIGMPILTLVILLAVGASFKPASVAPVLMPVQATADHEVLDDPSAVRS